MRFLGNVAGAAGCGGGGDPKETLTVFNYGEYMDPIVLDMFEDETGIEVKYEEALTAEEMYTKYVSGAVDYDLLCSTDYMLQRLIDEGRCRRSISALENGGISETNTGSSPRPLIRRTSIPFLTSGELLESFTIPPKWMRRWTAGMCCSTGIMPARS